MIIKILKSLFNDELIIKDISLIKSIIIAILYLLVPYSIKSIFIYIFNILDKDMSYGVSLAIISIFTWISTMFVIIISTKVFSNKEFDNKKENYITIRKRYILYVFFIMLGIVLIRLGLLFDILEKFKGPITKSEIDYMIKNIDKKQLSFIILVLMIQIIIIAPIFEELFFRGIIFKGILNHYKGDARKAILFSAIIFGVAHLNIPQGINGIVCGIILASIYYCTKSIKLCIFAHFLNNFSVLLPIPNTIFMKAIYVIVGIYLLSKGMKLFKQRIKVESNQY